MCQLYCMHYPCYPYITPYYCIAVSTIYIYMHNISPDFVNYIIMHLFVDLLCFVYIYIRFVGQVDGLFLRLKTLQYCFIMIYQKWVWPI